MKKKIDNGFALVRPPGHHSMRVVHGNRGFCNINNEAIMIEYLRQHYGLKKIAIVDTDVHHGDGTQDIYWHDPDVLFISFHQDGRTLYPGSGFPSELGGPNAFGMTINVPLEPGTTDEGIHYVLDNLVLPLLDDFQPDLIVNSAGQDNHYYRSAGQHALHHPGIRPAQREAEAGPGGAGGRLRHRIRPALRQYRHHPGHGRPGLLTRDRTGLSAGQVRAVLIPTGIYQGIWSPT